MTTDNMLWLAQDLVLGVDGRRPVEDYDPDQCCAGPMCLDPVALGCAYIDLLPSGPMWDEPKARLKDKLAECGSLPDPEDDCWTADPGCVTMVHYGLYAAQLLNDAVENILQVAIRESDPHTAVSTMDEWYDRLGYVDCYRTECRSSYLAKFSPYEKAVEGCEGLTEYVAPSFPDDYECALRRATVQSLYRARRGFIRNLDGINWILQPLGVQMEPVLPDDPPEPVEGYPICGCADVQFAVVPISETLEACPEEGDYCHPTERTVDAEQEYAPEGYEPITLYPAVYVGECIVRSLLPKLCPNLLGEPVLPPIEPYNCNNSILLDQAYQGTGHTFTDGGKGLINTTSSSTSNTSGDYHSVGAPASSGCDFGTGDFTIEGWVRSLSNHSVYFHSAMGNFKSSDAGSWSAFVMDAPNTRINWLVAGQPSLQGTSNIGSGWHHIVISRNTDTLRVFVDGVMEIKQTGYAAVNVGGSGNVILGGNNSGNNDQWRGLLDEIRITKGVGRYNADTAITVPTNKYPRDGTDPHWASVSLLAGFDSGAIDEGPLGNILTPTGTPTITTVAKIGEQAVAYNEGAGGDYKWWVPTVKKMNAGDGPFYWEVLFNPAGPVSFDGYAGVVTQDAVDSGDWENINNPVYDGSLGYRGDGTIYGNNGTQLSSTPASYGAGDIGMFAFDPSTGELWVGLNGVWPNDPVTDPALVTSSNITNGFYASMQGRRLGEGGTLYSVESDFAYPAPAGFMALGCEQVVPMVDYAQSSIILGTPVDGESADRSRSFVVHGRVNDGVSVPYQSTYLIIEE